MKLAQSPEKSRPQVLRAVQSWGVRISAGVLRPPEPPVSSTEAPSEDATLAGGGKPNISEEIAPPVRAA